MSPMDWLRVARLFNGFTCCMKDIIAPSSFAEFIRPSNASAGAIARDLFMGDDFFGYYHTGYYPGAYANYQRMNNGIELMTLQSKSSDTAAVFDAISKLSRLFIDLTPNWPQQDLFSA